jgi:Family of unknown function (DUF6159)
MGRIGRGWSLARQSLDVVLADGSLGALVVLGSATAAIAVGAALVPMLLFAGQDQMLWAYASLAVAVAVGSVVSVFFAVALAAAAAVVLDGGNATVLGALGVSWARRRAVLGWGLLVVTVNLVLQLVASRLGPLGRIVTGFVGVAWGLVTFLVVPVIALEGLGPGEALRRSGTIFRERWGEQVVGQVSITGVLMLVGLVPAGLLFGLALLGPGEETGPFEVVAIAAAVLVLLVSAVLAAAARAVFSVALLRYATGQGATGPYSAADLEQAVTVKA